MLDRLTIAGGTEAIDGNQTRKTGWGHMATKRTSKKATKNTTPEEFPIPDNKHVGRYFGKRVMDGQNMLFEANLELKMDDEELATTWNAEWPNACAYTPHHVKGARRDYNKGKHGQESMPKVHVPEFIISKDGERIAKGTEPKA
tara:strand:+ start:75 stop:506 length:432 start_codon:yes stop_codon:yes gene_type:complete